VCASSGGGVRVTVRERAGRTSGPFKPDFLLVRQNLRDAGEDYRNLLLGFQYGGLPCINSLESIYNFQDKPWVHAHLLEVQRRLGPDTFPLIHQTYHPDHEHMEPPPAFPCVLKVGHAHGGLGKVKVEGETSWRDLASVVAVSGTYCTVEEYIDAKYDLHIFKLGDHYRALIASHCCDCRRKSLGGNWKTNVGQSILEEVEVQERYKLWVDQVSEMFGGLDICSLEAVVGKDGREVIIEVNDCALSLMGDSQEEDRRHMAEMVLAKMEERCGLAEEHTNGVAEPGEEAEKQAAVERKVLEKMAVKAKVPPGPVSADSRAVKTKLPPGPIQRGPPDRTRNPSLGSGSTSTSASDSSEGSGGTVRQGDQEEPVVEGEDTMRNLRTTFAGIFGEIK